MLRNRSLLFDVVVFVSIFILLFVPSKSTGQAWSGLLAPNRAIDWSRAGAGTIPARTTICQTLGVAGQSSSYAQSVTTAQIYSAMRACAGTNQAVLLNPGTYTMNGTLGVTASGNPFPSNVTLRGSGANQTILTWPSSGVSFTNCDGYGATAVCIENGDPGAATYSTNVVQVTGGVTPGSTSVTLGGPPSGNVCGNPNSPNACSGSVSNLHVGSLIAFNQLDPASDNGNWWACGTPWAGSTNTNCSQQGEAGNSWGGRSLTQTVTVTGISGSTVTFSPGLYGQTWSSANAPYATFSSTAPTTGVGIENLQLNTVSSGDIWTMVEFFWATNSWVNNVAMVNAVGSNVGAGTGSARNHIQIASAAHITVQNSYMYGSAPTSEGYGVDILIGGSDNLVQNNIFQHMAAPIMLEDAIGNVFGYNFVVDNFYVGAGGNAGNWQQCDLNNHGAGDNYNLFESGEGICASEDDIHGTSFANTYFRNYLSGHDPATLCPGGGTSCGTLPKNQNTEALELLAHNRYVNFVSNVVGSSYFSAYQNEGASGSPNSCAGSGWNAIYQLNFADQDLIPFSPTCVGSSFTIDNDPLVSTSLMRWGNYDSVHGSVQTNSAETASGASTYPGLATPSTSWGSYPSLYLSSQPSWWGSMPWPIVGPDVTGGNVANVGGHVYHNPAATCYLNVLGGKTDGSSGVLSFDASACYLTAASAGGPLPPSNLTGTVVQ